MSKTVSDPVFGKLELNEAGSWAGRSRVGISAKPGAGLQVHASHGEPPSEPQREAYRRLLAATSTLKGQVEQRLYTYYNTVKERYREWLDPESAAEDVPELNRAADIWKLLSGLLVVVPVQPRKGWLVKLNWECRWDEEHGVQVVVADGRVKSVGLQQ